MIWSGNCCLNNNNAELCPAPFCSPTHRETLPRNSVYERYQISPTEKTKKDSLMCFDLIPI